MNGLPKTVTRQRRGCDLNPGLSAPESSTLTTRLPSQPGSGAEYCNERVCLCVCVCLFVHNCISGTTRPIFTRIFVRVTSGSVVIRYVLPVLWMMSYLLISA